MNSPSPAKLLPAPNTSTGATKSAKRPQYRLDIELVSPRLPFRNQCSQKTTTKPDQNPTFGMAVSGVYTPKHCTRRGWMNNKQCEDIDRIALTCQRGKNSKSLNRVPKPARPTFRQLPLQSLLEQKTFAADRAAFVPNRRLFGTYIAKPESLTVLSRLVQPRLIAEYHRSNHRHWPPT